MFRGGTGLLDIRPDDATCGAGSGQSGKVDPEFAGDLAGEGGCLDARAIGGDRGCNLNGCGGCRSFLGGGRGGGGFLGGWGGIARVIAIENSEHTADGGFLAFLNHDRGDCAFIESLHFHRGLVGLDLGEDIADLDAIADLLVPFDEGAFGHGVRELGHFDVY